jgi:anti-anti-sigma factor
MNVTSDSQGGRFTLTLSGHVDASAAARINDHFQGFRPEDHDTVIVDVTGVARMGSAAIGRLLLVYKQVVSEGRTLRVEGASTELQALFKALKIDTLFPICQ